MTGFVRIAPDYQEYRCDRFRDNYQEDTQARIFKETLSVGVRKENVECCQQHIGECQADPA